jgi:endo-1,4-beta-D-glucanase Y
MHHFPPVLLSLVIVVMACSNPLRVSQADGGTTPVGAGGRNTMTDASIAAGGTTSSTGGPSGAGGTSLSAPIGSGGVASIGGATDSGGAGFGGSAGMGGPGSGGLPSSGGTTVGGSSDASGGNACSSPRELISDFESPPGQAAMIRQEAREGYWYVYFPGSETSSTPATGMKLTPALNDGRPIATEAAGDATACHQFALHSTGSGFDSQYEAPAGFGAVFKPHSWPDRIADAYDVSAYSAISFKIKSGGATAPAVFFEVLTKDVLPASAGGTAADESVDLYTTRGQLLTKPWSATDISTDYQTFTVPFGTLVPRWLPTTNGRDRAEMKCTVAYGSNQPRCQARPFKGKDVLGIRFSMYVDDGFPKPDGSTAGSYDLWVDDVAFVKDDAGLRTREGFPLRKPGSYGSCSYPRVASANAKFLVPAYEQWKTKFVRDDKVIRPDNQNDTLSEGVAFGMLISLNLNDQPLFDALYGTWKGHPATNAATLMKSCLGSGGGSTGTACTASNDSATGADQDAAYALLMADKLWGGTYKADAIAMLKDIWDKDIDGAGSKLPKGGSGFQAPTGTKAEQITKPAYFAPSFYRAYASADPDSSHDWAAVISAVYAVISGPVAGSYGLLPAWCGNSCTVAASIGGDNDGYFQYDSHRVPMRIGLDYCFNNAAEAKAYTKLTTDFFARADASGPGLVSDLYTLSGGAVRGSASGSASVLGTAAVGAMASGNQSFVDDAYQATFDVATRGSMAPAIYVNDSHGYVPHPEPTYGYYNATVGLLTLLILTGNFLH